MCPHYLWKEVINGSWIARMSPFNHKILDVRVASSSSNVTLKVSTIEGEIDFYAFTFKNNYTLLFPH